MPRFLLLLAALFALLPEPAAAQNQPQSTRAYKGPPFTVASSVTAPASVTCSNVLDVRAYNSLLVRVTPSPVYLVGTEGTIFGVAGRYVQICYAKQLGTSVDRWVVYALYSEDGATNFFQFSGLGNRYTTSSITAVMTSSIVVTPLSDPLMVSVVGATAGTAIDATRQHPVLNGGVRLSDVAMAAYQEILATYDSQGAAATRSVWAGDVDRCGGTSPNAAIASSSNGTKVANPSLAALAESNDGTDVTIQNVGTVALYCKVGDNDTPPTITSSNYKFALAAGTASNDGTGGSATITGVGPREAIYCLAASGTGAAAFFCR